MVVGIPFTIADDNSPPMADWILDTLPAVGALHSYSVSDSAVANDGTSQYLIQISQSSDHLN